MNETPKGLPLINQMGVDTAARQPELNKAVKAQLEFVFDEIEHYIGAEQMPHEWGSLDSYDDMRNSLWVAAALMDALLNPDLLDDAKETLDARGACATDERVWELLGIERP